MDVETIPDQQKWNFCHQKLSRQSRSGPTTQHGRGCAAAATTTPTSPGVVDQDMGTCSCCIGRMQETERAVPCSRFAGWIRRCLDLHHSCLVDDDLFNKTQILSGHTNQTQQLKCTHAQNSTHRIMVNNCQ
jgi:hypothetical protein